MRRRTQPGLRFSCAAHVAQPGARAAACSTAVERVVEIARARRAPRRGRARRRARRRSPRAIASSQSASAVAARVGDDQPQRAPIALDRFPRQEAAFDQAVDHRGDRRLGDGEAFGHERGPLVARATPTPAPGTGPASARRSRVRACGPRGPGLGRLAGAQARAPGEDTEPLEARTIRLPAGDLSRRRAPA